MHRPVRIKTVWILLACTCAILGTFVAIATSEVQWRSYAQTQLEAAQSMHAALGYLHDEIVSHGITIEEEDLNKTGLIGPEFTELTSTPGNVDAKRTALNPNFAAAMVRYYHEAGLDAGDTIAVGTSGSFPGLFIASMVAAKQMDLHVNLIASCGSSMHGATRTEFTIFDIARSLQEGGFTSFDLLGVSPGGANDQGGSVLEGILYEGTPQLAQDLCQATGAPILLYDDLAQNIKHRLELYGENIQLFVNIGGASPNCGASSYTLNFPQGLVIDPPTIPTTPYRGLSYEYAARGIPVLNLLNVRLLAHENGIAYDPVPMQAEGSGGTYATRTYDIWIIMATWATTLALLAIGYLQGRRQRAREAENTP